MKWNQYTPLNFIFRGYNEKCLLLKCLPFVCQYVVLLWVELEAGLARNKETPCCSYTSWMISQPQLLLLCTATCMSLLSRTTHGTHTGQVLLHSIGLQRYPKGMTCKILEWGGTFCAVGPVTSLVTNLPPNHMCSRGTLLENLVQYNWKAFSTPMLNTWMKSFCHHLPMFLITVLHLLVGHHLTPLNKGSSGRCMHQTQ